MTYSKTIIGRHEEQDILKACVNTDKAEFIAVYGRRRVGKTYLIKQYFKNQFDFYTSGIYDLKNEEQLENFRQQLIAYGSNETRKLKNCFFADMTHTKKTLYLTMVTTFGVKRNKYYGMVQNEIVLDQLF